MDEKLHDALLERLRTNLWLEADPHLLEDLLATALKPLREWLREELASVAEQYECPQDITRWTLEDVSRKLDELYGEEAKCLTARRLGD